MGDPWKHRSASMSCATCMWYVPKEDVPPRIDPRPGAPLAASEPPLGRCRKRAPTMDGYPVVFPNDWCGQHKLDGAKLPQTVTVPGVDAEE